jgi:hypothetical protein
MRKNIVEQSVDFRNGGSRGPRHSENLANAEQYFDEFLEGKESPREKTDKVFFRDPWWRCRELNPGPKTSATNVYNHSPF